jgi:hypothetical protein
VGKVSWPGSALSTSSTTLVTQVRDLFNSQPVADATASLCAFRDLDCGAPIAPPQTSDDAGNVAFTLPFSAFGFGSSADTYTQVTAPGYVPALYFIGYGVSEPRAPLAEPFVIIAKDADVPAFFEPKTWDQTLAWVQVGVFDCTGTMAPGVTLAIDSQDGIGPYYYSGTGTTWVPDFNAKATSTFAYGGFINVPPGRVKITATPLGLDKPSATVDVLARAGTLSNYFMFPTP